MTENKKDKNPSIFSVKMFVNDLGEIDIGNENIIVFEMIEDIFSVSMVGKLVLLDRVGALELFPLTGSEIISIVYGEEQKLKTFLIYNFKKVNQGIDSFGSSMTVLELYLVEPFYLPLTQEKFSVSWKNKKISDIVVDICTNMIGISKLEKIETTKEVLPLFYMPYWTPLEALKWLLKRSSSQNKELPGYLLYSTTKGVYYQSIETLFTMGVEEDNFIFVDSSELGDISKILSWNIEHVDFQSSLYLGGGHKFGYDFEKKEFLDKEYDYSEIISKYTLFGKKTLFYDLSSKRRQYTFEGDNDTKLLTNIAYHEFITRYCKQFAVSLLLRGRETRYAGMIIDVPWKSTVKGEYLHKLYQGKFLVKSITHQFSGKMKPEYRQMMMVLKTGYSDADTNILHKATKYRL